MRLNMPLNVSDPEAVPGICNPFKTHPKQDHAGDTDALHAPHNRTSMLPHIGEPGMAKGTVETCENSRLGFAGIRHT